MVLGNGLMIVWLDTYIGVAGEYQQFKQQFDNNLESVTTMPPNNINEMILYFERNVSPIRFVSTQEDALGLIESEREKKIILISSGTLGQPIIPHIISNFPRVYSFYIFCAQPRYLTEWALDNGYEECLKIFVHETDLLARLMRDISKDIIQLGRSYLELNDGKSAEKCFLVAETLEISANRLMTGHAPLLDQLRLLQDDNGLIHQARRRR